MSARTPFVTLALSAIVASSVFAQDVRIARLEAQPSRLSLAVGETTELTVRAVDANGNVVDVPVRVGGPRRSVQVRGETVRGLEAGEFEIVAVAAVPGADPVTLSIPVSVHWPAVVHIGLTAERGTLYTGTTIAHRAEAHHADGSARPGAGFAWNSSDPNVATVNRFGQVTGIRAGAVTITAEFENVTATREYTVRDFPAVSMTLDGGLDVVRTGDVQTFEVAFRDAGGAGATDIPVLWTHAYTPPEGVMGPSAPGQVQNGKFVADVPGVYTVMASAGHLSSRKTFEVVPRDAVQELAVIGTGRQSTVRTTDFWIFEGVDGRDYAITGAKVSDGHAYVFDVTDPANIIKTDSIQVDARSVNDVKVSPDARYATVTREGASNRRNGVVILDLANPAHPTVASSYDEGLTGGVHNAYPTNDYLFALSGGDKYVIIDVRDIYNPRYVSEYNHPDSRVHDVWVHDGVAYSAEWGTGVVVVDVGNGRWGGSIDNPVFVTNYPVATGGTHAVFPYEQKDTGKFYVFIGDEIMSRTGLANAGTGRPRGDYAQRFDPATGEGGTPLTTQGYIQVIDFTDPEHPEMVARYEVTEYGTHNIWVEDDKLYQAYYEGGLRVVDVSGELMGNLYTQGREIAVFKPFDPQGYVANSPMVWSAMPFKGHVWFTDTNSGIWSVKITPKGRPVM